LARSRGRGDEAMLTDIVVFRAAMTRPGELAKPKAGDKK
jgi:hypothetical protein